MTTEITTEITQRVSAASHRQEAVRVQHGGDRRHDNRDHTESECSMEETGGMATEITQRVSSMEETGGMATEITQSECSMDHTENECSMDERRQEAWRSHTVQHGDRRHGNRDHKCSMEETGDNRDHRESECSMEETGGMATEIEITQRVSAAWRRQEA